MLDNKTLAKLRQPVHISYISTYIFKKPLEETRTIIQDLVDKNIVEEYSPSRDYFVLKSQIKKK